MQYVALIYTNQEEDAARPPEAQQEEFKGYFAFNTLAKEQNAYLAGEALMPASGATSVRVRNGERIVTDGPFAETREALGGFYLLDCRDLEHAIELASKIPAAAHGTVEVREVMLIPGDG